jgi:hypothetical protein
LVAARVRVLRAGQPGLSADLDTDSAGRFRAPDLPEGNYRLEVSKPNYVSAAVDLPGPGSAPQSTMVESIMVRLVKLGVIAGRVVDAKHQPVRDAFVFPRTQMLDGTAQASLVTARTDTRGEYRLHGLFPGIYSVAVTLAGFGSGAAAGAMLYPNNSSPELFTISGGEEYRNVDFAFTPSTLHGIRGRVVLPEAGGRYSVALVPVDQPSLIVATAQTASDGAFHIRGVPAGSYHLFASGPVIGHGALLGPNPRYGRTQVDVVGQDLTDVSIEAMAGRSVTFVLAAEAPLPAGACPPSAPLRLLPLEDRAARIMQEIRVSFEEERRVEGLAPGRYHLALASLGEKCFLAANPVLDLEGEPSPERVSVLVTPAGAIHGRLLAGSKAASGYTVVLVPSVAAPETNTQGVQAAVPDAESRFAFADLRPGRYRIAARPAGIATSRWVPELSKMFEIDVLGGAPTELELPVAAE